MKSSSGILLLIIGLILLLLGISGKYGDIFKAAFPTAFGGGSGSGGSSGGNSTTPPANTQTPASGNTDPVPGSEHNPNPPQTQSTPNGVPTTVIGQGGVLPGTGVINFNSGRGTFQ